MYDSPTERKLLLNFFQFFLFIMQFLYRVASLDKNKIICIISKVPKQVCEDKPKEVTKTVCTGKHVDNHEPAQHQYGPPEVIHTTPNNMIADKYPFSPSNAELTSPSYPPLTPSPDPKPLEYSPQPLDLHSKTGNTFCKEFKLLH